MMKKSQLAAHKREIVVVLAWLGLLIILYIDNLLFKIETYLIYPTYMIVVSLILVKYLEKESIKERFGLQKHNVLGLLLGCLVFVIFLAISGTQEIRGVIIAPITEEIFFRGYMLGAIARSTSTFPEWTQTLRKLIFHIRNKSLKASLKGSVQISPSHFVWAIMISVLFAISHIFELQV